MTNRAFAFLSPPSVCFHVRTHRMRNNRSGFRFSSSSCERQRTASAAKTYDNSFCHSFIDLQLLTRQETAMLWMTFLSGTNPPIRQKIPHDVSSCNLQRAPEPLAFQPLRDCQVPCNTFFSSARYLEPKRVR